MQKTRVKISENKIVDYKSQYSFLGSCFSEHLSSKMTQAGFPVQANPFGVVFNPISLAEILLVKDEVLMDSVFERKVLLCLGWPIVLVLHIVKKNCVRN